MPEITMIGSDPSGVPAKAQIDGSGNLKVAVTGAGSGGTSSVDEASFTASASAGTPLMGAVTPGDTVASGKLAVAAMQVDRSLNVYVTGQAGGGSAVSVADGADQTQGAIADAAVDTNTTGTISGKLRGLVKLLASVISVGRLVVDPSGVTSPVSGTVTANLGTIGAASTAAKQPALGTAGTASADVITIQGIASMTKLLVTPDSVALPANQSCNTAQINGVTPLMGSGNTGTGSLRVTIATDQPALTNKLLVTPDAGSTVSQVPATAGGLLISRTLSVNNTTGTNPKGSAGQVYGWVITNTNAAARFVKLYNKATAPSVGSDTPVITLTIPGNTAGAGMTFNTDSGIAFGTGIGMGITTGVADADTGAPAANEVVVNLFYK